MERKTKLYHEKVYKKKDLLSLWYVIDERIKLIEHFTSELKHFPETKFQITDETIIYNQKRIDRKKYSELNFTQKQEILIDLAKSLDQLSKLNFVHGDLNNKNIIYDGKQLWVIDLEPDLKQIKYGRVALFITRPYYSKEDIEDDNITSRTDKIAWFAYNMKLFYNRFYKNNEMLYQEIEQFFRLEDLYKAKYSAITEDIIKKKNIKSTHYKV